MELKQKPLRMRVHAWGRGMWQAWCPWCGALPKQGTPAEAYAEALEHVESDCPLWYTLGEYAQWGFAQGSQASYLEGYEDGLGDGLAA